MSASEERAESVHATLLTLLARERELNRLRQDMNELYRWMSAAQETAIRVSGAPDYLTGMRYIAELIAEELGFDHAFVRCGSLACDLPPLTAPDEIERIDELLRACQTGPPARSVSWDSGPEIRFALCVRVDGHGPDEPPILAVAARTARTLAYFAAPNDDLLERFRQTVGRTVHSLAALRLRRALMTERDTLQSRVEAATDDLRRALSLAEAARAEAELSARVRSEFLANMSHEIRTPMTAILGYAELLLDPGLSETTRVEHLFTVRRSGQHLLSLLDDILDLARLESGRFTIDRQPCSPSHVLGDVISMLRCRATDKAISLELTFSTPLPSRISTDATRLRQILINLIGNAIKFTSRGAVEVRACYVRNEGDGTLLIDVVDSGIGMTEEQLQRIFEPFTQADASTTRTFGGTGLGLSIARRLARLLGGDITGRSEPGRGSVFSVRIATGPLEPGPWYTRHEEIVQPAQEIAPSTLIGRVLVAEDVALNRRLFQQLLLQAGVEVALVPDGREAILAMQAADREGRAFDVVLMDMQMPVMDGYEATAQLRALGYRTPVIALTAHSMAGDMEKCLRAGCTSYLSKPVSYNALVAMLSRYLLPVSSRPTSLPPLESDLSRDPTIGPLVADYVRELPEELESIQSAIAAGDPKAISAAAHRLKGVSMGFGFPSIGARAAQVEHLARESAPLTDIRDAMGRLLREASRVR